MGIIRRRLVETGAGWTGVEPLAYGVGGSIAKHILIGPDEGAKSFAVRFFEVPAGQASMNEHHPHDHGVLIVGGRCRVLLGSDQCEVGPGDFVWVPPDEQHQFESLGPEPLQFYCVVPAWGETDAKAPLSPPESKG